MHKLKILQQLKTKYPGVANAVLELIATKLAATVKEEAEIDGAITGLDNMPITVTEYADLLQKEGDRRVTEAQKKFQEKKDPPKEDKKDDPKDDPDPMKQILKRMEEMNRELVDLRTSKNREALSEKLAAKLKEKKIPVALAKGRVVESEEQLEGLVTEIEADYESVKQDLANDGFSQIKPPISGLPNPSAKSVEADIKAWAKSAQPQAEGASK